MRTFEVEIEEDWQNDCHGLSERYGELGRRGLWTDCEFSVGATGARAVCHRVLLAAASPVFAEMLFGTSSPQTPRVGFLTTPIRIEDIEIEPFQRMLEYIYTDNITLTSSDEACSLYYAAHKYQLTHLASECQDYLLGNVNESVVVKVYQMAESLDDKKLMIKCLEIMNTANISVPT